MDKAQRQAFGRRVTFESLAPLSIVLMMLYAAIAIAHYFVLPEGAVRFAMIGVAFGSSVLCATVLLALNRTLLPERHAELLLCLLAAIILTNVATHMWLLEDVQQTALFALAMVAAGFFSASTPTLTLIIMVYLGVWWVINDQLPPTPTDQHNMMLMLIAASVAISTNIVRMRYLFKVEADKVEAQRRILSATEDNRNYLARILNAIEPGLCVIDRDDRVSLANEKFAGYLNTTAGELAGQTFRSAIQGTPFADTISTARVGEREVSLPETDVHLSVRETVLPSSASPHHDSRLVLAVDITQRKRIVSEREQLLQSVHEAQRLESLGLLAGGIAHDFNNLLAIVVGSLEMLTVEGIDSQHVTAARDAALRAASLTRQMLAYTGSDTTAREWFDAYAEVVQITKLLKASADRNVRFCIETDGGAMLVNADRAQFQQVIMNTALNAAEAYAGAEGAVDISVSRVSLKHSDEVSVVGDAVLAPGDYIRIVVADGAGGIAPEHLSEIFTPFFSTKGLGRGLGLSACIGILQKHDGGIGIDSTVGAGTRITVLLPASEGEQHRDAEVDQSLLQGLHAWIVDDEPSITAITGKMLTTSGMSISTYQKARDALADLKAGESSDVFLLDVSMPDMDGVALFTAVRAIAPQQPVVFMSGYDATGVLDNILANTTNVDFLRKPFKREALVKTMARLLAPAE